MHSVHFQDGKRPPRRRLIFHRWLGSGYVGQSTSKHHREDRVFCFLKLEVGTLIIEEQRLVLIHHSLVESLEKQIVCSVLCFVRKISNRFREVGIFFPFFFYS